MQAETVVAGNQYLISSRGAEYPLNGARPTLCTWRTLGYGRLQPFCRGRAPVTARYPHRIVFANEKGGTGKSTTAVHIAIALAYQGAKVAAIDLDPRQRTLYRYFENRVETERRRGIELPGAAFGVFVDDSLEALEEQAAQLGQGADFMIVDTPV